MKPFSVLDRHLQIHQHYFLEASAGTGKTFSIQNIVVRLLIEPHGTKKPLLIHEILVVTFTKAATRDLKLRIRGNIEESLHFLTCWLQQNPMANSAPDFLRAYMEKGETSVREACKYLQQALFMFDQAQIFTIHSFCARMLRQYIVEGDIGLHSFYGDEPLPASEIMGVIRDFFRTEVALEQYCPAQIAFYLSEDPLQKKLFHTIQSTHEFPSFRSIQEILQHFNVKMREIKQHFDLTTEKIMEDFRLQITGYRNYKTGETKEETINKVFCFAQLFDQEEWEIKDLDSVIRDGLVWVQALDPTLLKGKPIPESSLHYPQLTKYLSVALQQCVDEARDFSILLVRMASDCRELLRRYQSEEEKLSPDDILRKMNHALHQTAFTTQIQSLYQTAIIDEFQDTDPLQWQIFKRLFFSELNPWQGYLYLVGDPKQSIYSFRQADIYTYLEAAELLGNSHCFSLSINYRSQPNLVEALNFLFSSEHLPHFIPLPKKSSFLPYHPVQAASSDRQQFFDDEGSAVHFFIADASIFIKPKIVDLETHVFFPFIGSEIQRLKETKDIRYDQCAVLVKDRFQAMRLTEYLDRLKIPYHNQRGMSLTASAALQSLKDCMHAVLHPCNRGAIRTALGSPLMGWTSHEIKQMKSMEPHILYFHRLNMSLIKNGFASFFQDLLHSCTKDAKSLLEQILEREEGRLFYHDLQQIADMIIHHQYREWNGPEGIIPFLDRFEIWEKNDDERVKRFQHQSAEGVKILTLHFSKGLEFDIVFALGLVNRTKASEDLITVDRDGQILYTPFSEQSEEYKKYCEETDAEKMRQLYVALTRAKYRLYIPIALHLSAEKLKWGEASPLDVFLAHLHQPIHRPYPELYERIQSGNSSDLMYLLEKGSLHCITHSIHKESIADPTLSSLHKTPSLLFKPTPISISAKPLWITSFSALSQSTDHQATQQNHAPLSKPPNDYKSQIKDVHTMPAHSETGLCIHKILEKVNFSDFTASRKVENVLPLIRPFLRNTPLQEWEIPVANLILNTLQIGFSAIDENFCLGNLLPTDMYREMPFIFSCAKEMNIHEMEYREGFIKGVIDLFFQSNGLYYIVDWKTNWLGPCSEDYHFDSMEAVMHEYSYFLQAALYTDAAKRYLQLVEQRPFEECFGGVFYIFLRGLQPGQKTGIFHFFPSLAPLAL